MFSYTRRIVNASSCESIQGLLYWQSFIKLGDATDDEPTAKVIKVTNKRLDMSCVWSVAKLKERLVRMRKLVYAVSPRAPVFRY